MGFFEKRIGKMYNYNGSVNQAIPIDPFSLTNLNVNYTVKNNSFMRGSKLGLSVNNLFDSHNMWALLLPTDLRPQAPSLPRRETC